MTKIQRLRDSLWWMVLAALAIRLVLVGFLYPEQLAPGGDHISFGYETGRIARSLALGHGFSDPLYGHTGPTAWLTPIYPGLVAGVFKLFGIYTKASALVMLSLNSLISALTCLPVFFMARRSFGQSVGAWAGWTWCFYPYAVYWAAERIWDESLAALLLAIGVALALRLEHPARLRAWVGFGILWGLAGLTNPMTLSVLPFLIAWICYRRRRRNQQSIRQVAVALLALVVTVSPWFVRNYLVFHRFIPFRDVFWLVLRTANTSSNWERWTYWTHPAGNKMEYDKMARLGEPAYMDVKKRETIEFIRQHPRLFVELTIRRFFNVWTGAWNLHFGYLIAEDFEIANILIYTTWTVLMLTGLWYGFRLARHAVLPYALVLFGFTLMLYVSSPNMRYRFPIEPEIVVLAAYGVVTSATLARQKTAAEAVGERL